MQYVNFLQPAIEQTTIPDHSLGITNS